MSEDAAVRLVRRRPGRTRGSCRASTRRRGSRPAAQSLDRFREEQLRPGAIIPACVEREFSFLLDGDRVRGRFDRVDIIAARPRRARPRRWSTTVTRPAAPTSSSRPSTCGRSRSSITDYKSSDVRDPAKARQRAKDSLQLSIYAMAYEAMTGRLPDAVALHFLESGLVGRAPVDRKRIEKARETIRTAAARDPGAGLHGQARLPLVQLLRLPRDLPVQRRPLTACRARRRGPLGGRRRARGRGARARWSRPTTSTCSATLPDGLVDLCLRRPAVRDGRDAAAGVDPDRRRGADAARVRWPRVPLRGRLGPRV